jgi:putative ABC transport system permease protein
MESWMQDLRYGARMLLRSPGFAAVAILTLALGIGANTAIFSVIEAVLLRPLAYQNPDRLVLINHDYPKLNLKASVSAPGYAHYRDHAGSFSSVAALTGWNANLTGAGEPERIQANTVTANFFATLGVQPARGRLFQADEDQPGRNHVVVLSDGLWHRRFGGDPSLLNQTITLNGEAYTILGIMPPGFEFGRELGRQVDLWAPIAFTPDQLDPRNLTNEYLVVLARLKPGVSLMQARAEMDTIATNLRRQYMPGMDRSAWGLTLQPLRELVIGDIGPALMILGAAVAFVLLIACANVANLLLARAAVREKEVATRTALGASRGRVVRQLLTESMLLSVLGGGVGWALAFWGVRLLSTLEDLGIPRAYEIRLDGIVLAFTLGISLLTGILFGLVPALQSSRCDLHEALKEGGRTGTGGIRHRMRDLLVVAETALALVLLIGSGLLIKSFVRVQQVSPGFHPDHVLAMQVSLPAFKYKEAGQIDTFYRQALESIRRLPGVQSAGATSILPMSGQNSSGSFRIEGRAVQTGEVIPHGDRWSVTEGYFQAMQIPLVRGRTFTAQDTAEAPGVAIIDETMARKYWPREDPLGQRITFEGTADKPRWREIVGIVGHVKHKGLEGESRVQYYLPHRQRPLGAMALVVRGASDPASMATPVRKALRELDADLPVFRVTTMDQLVADSSAQRRFSTLLIALFSALALVLAVVGLYGIMTYAVVQRSHEIGVRMALGAQQSNVLAMIVRQGMTLTAAGLVIGLGSAWGLTRLMSNLLFEVTATDPWVFAVLSMVLAGVALLALIIPARRAARVDPLIALRYE